MPIFHSRHILLLKDSSSWLHETLSDVYLEDQGMTIEKALTMNSCTVIRNKDCFKTSIEKIEENSEPFFLLDF